MTNLRIELGSPEGTTAFDVVRVLRALPGRRMAVRARGGDGDVFLKLHLGAGAKSRSRREVARHARARAAGIPVPRLQKATVVASAGGICPRGSPALVYAWLEIVPCSSAVAGDRPEAALHELAAVLGRLHGAGLGHADPHLGNFGLTATEPRGVVVLDPTAVVRRRRARGRAAVGDLAALLAQIDPRLDHLHPELLGAYGREVGRGAPPLARVRDATRRARARRLRALMRKVERPSSRTLLWGRTLVAAGCGLDRAGKLLRVDRDAPAEGIFVVTGDDARQSWRHAHALELLGVPAVRPVALVRPRGGAARFIGTAPAERAALEALLSRCAELGLSPADGAVAKGGDGAFIARPHRVVIGVPGARR